MSAGQDPEAFWRLTPREITAVMRGIGDRLHREQTERAWLAWHVAVLSRAKKLPPFEKMIPRAQPRKPNRADTEMVRGYFMALAARSAERRRTGH